MAPLALVRNLATRWRHLHYWEIWPPLLEFVYTHVVHGAHDKYQVCLWGGGSGSKLWLDLWWFETVYNNLSLCKLAIWSNLSKSLVFTKKRQTVHFECQIRTTYEGIQYFQKWKSSAHPRTPPSPLPPCCCWRKKLTAIFLTKRKWSGLNQQVFVFLSVWVSYISRNIFLQKQLLILPQRPCKWWWPFVGIIDNHVSRGKVVTITHCPTKNSNQSRNRKSTKYSVLCGTAFDLFWEGP